MLIKNKSSLIPYLSTLIGKGCGVLITPIDSLSNKEISHLISILIAAGAIPLHATKSIDISCHPEIKYISIYALNYTVLLQSKCPRYGYYDLIPIKDLLSLCDIKSPLDNSYNHASFNC